MKRKPELDGLRGVAILMVIALHDFEVPPSARAALRHFPRLHALIWLQISGVDLFFVLSGFLIGGIVLDNARADNFERVFYARRALRILPIYFLFLSLSALPLFAIKPTEVPILGYFLFAQNIIASRWVPEAFWILPAWSIAIEEHFYLLAPVGRRLSRHRLSLVLSGTIVASLALRGMLWHRNPVAVRMLTICRMDGLAIGVLLALFVRSRWANLPRLRALRAAPALAAAVYVGLSQTRLRGEWTVRVLGPTVLAFAFAGVILSVLRLPDGAFARALRTKPLTMIGERSYFLYLFHLPAWIAVSRIGMGLAATALVSFSVVAALSALSFPFLESPLVRLGHRMRYEDGGVAIHGNTSTSMTPPETSSPSPVLLRTRP